MPLSDAARATFDEFLLTLLLHQHPHNYCDEIANPAPVPIPGLISRAERYMIGNASAAITVSDVAAELGVSVRVFAGGISPVAFHHSQFIPQTDEIAVGA